MGSSRRTSLDSPPSPTARSARSDAIADDGVSGALKTDAAEAHGVLDELITAQLLAPVPYGQRNSRPTGSVVGLEGGTE
ncbi:hypothetical protein ABZ408_11095 [Streptomyces tibetensis]